MSSDARRMRSASGMRLERHDPPVVADESRRQHREIADIRADVQEHVTSEQAIAKRPDHPGFVRLAVKVMQPRRAVRDVHVHFEPGNRHLPEAVAGLTQPPEEIFLCEPVDGSKSCDVAAMRRPVAMNGVRVREVVATAAPTACE